MIVKLDRQDILKAAELLTKNKTAVFVNVTMEGPRINLTFTSDDGKLTTVTLFDTKTQARATVTKAEEL